MHKAEVANYINNPEILIPCGRFHDLFCRWQLDQRRVLHFGADGDDVLRVILNGPGRFLCDGADGRENQGDHNSRFEMVHTMASLAVGDGVQVSARYPLGLEWVILSKTA